METINDMRKQNISPAGHGIFSAYMLKWIAAITMLIDHTARILLKGYVNEREAYLTGKEYAYLGTLYDWMRHIGRMAFPLFAFLLVEGFFHTRDRKKYGIRLLAAALISEVPFDLAMYGSVCSWLRQNVLFTLLLGLIFMQISEWLAVWGEKAHWKGGEGIPDWMALLLRLLTFAAGGMLAYACRLDYTYKGIALIAVFYFFYQYRSSAAVAGFCVFAWNPWSLPAFLLIPFYNGRRGGRGRKWFYLFYPAHLLALYGLLAVLLRI